MATRVLVLKFSLPTNFNRSVVDWLVQMLVLHAGVTVSTEVTEDEEDRPSHLQVYSSFEASDAVRCAAITNKQEWHNTGLELVH